jgi:predicted TIM-barrel fold metal-dependent hydrolase
MAAYRSDSVIREGVANLVSVMAGATVEVQAPSLTERQAELLGVDRDQLDSIIRTHGADKLCLGTDYPFDMSEPDPVGFHAHLAPEVQDRIMGLNAADLLGLAPKPAGA